MRRKLPSRASASRPVRVGSKGTLTRNIFFWAPFTTTPYFPQATCMPFFGTPVKASLPRLRRPHFHLAYQSPFWHSQQHEYNLPNVFWRYLPTRATDFRLAIGFFRPSAIEFCIDA